MAKRLYAIKPEINLNTFSFAIIQMAKACMHTLDFAEAQSANVHLEKYDPTRTIGSDYYYLSRKLFELINYFDRIENIPNRPISEPGALLFSGRKIVLEELAQQITPLRRLCLKYLPMSEISRQFSCCDPEVNKLEEKKLESLKDGALRFSREYIEAYNDLASFIREHGFVLPEGVRFQRIRPTVCTIGL